MADLRFPSKEAAERIRQHVADWSEADEAEPFGTPRIILMATEYPATVTSTAVFLSELGLEFSLLKFQAYQTPSSEYVLTLSRLYPIDDVERLRVSPRIREKVVVERARAERTVHRLVDSGKLMNDTLLSLSPDDRWASRLSEYLSENPARASARWMNDRTRPLKWEADGERYTPTGLVKQIVEKAGFTPFPLPGPMWWQNADGRTLVQLADEVQ